MALQGRCAPVHAAARASGHSPWGCQLEQGGDLVVPRGADARVGRVRAARVLGVPVDVLAGRVVEAAVPGVWGVASPDREGRAGGVRPARRGAGVRGPLSLREVRDRAAAVAVGAHLREPRRGRRRDARRVALRVGLRGSVALGDPAVVQHVLDEARVALARRIGEVPQAREADHALAARGQYGLRVRAVRVGAPGQARVDGH
mmetsp:Transcript_109154/g.284588  ORF Transcript_109154/g.284588 Transcript_109154/m.284588 type:complete len:203 (+) Transcript_109154:554-1162(+)